MSTFLELVSYQSVPQNLGSTHLRCHSVPYLVTLIISPFIIKLGAWVENCDIDNTDYDQIAIATEV